YINGAYTFDLAQGKHLLSSWRRTDNQLSSSCRQVDAKVTTECGEMYGIKDKTRQDKTRKRVLVLSHLPLLRKSLNIAKRETTASIRSSSSISMRAKDGKSGRIL
ncbi:MAG: hypothetical protein IJ091_01855, partial [Oscillospiraceae bacterium]|nr:hypothetical protein [Oscillospiraceae bacterium]